VKKSVRFIVLGPVRAWRGEHELSLGTPQSRTLLALLLAHGGEVVSLPHIVDAMWGTEPPRTAVNSVQRNVGLLRRLIEPGLTVREPGGWLIRSAGGYRLDVDPDSLDLLHFRELVEKARAGDEPGLYLEALNLWQGVVADGIDPTTRADTVFTSLDQELTAVAREAADVALAAGEADRLRRPVSLAADRAPYDEPLHARLIRLCAGSGQRAGALTVYERLRRRLADELGITPGPEVTAARDAVLHPRLACPHFAHCTVSTVPEDDRSHARGIPL
jgi:DNA-binding SARP family transcriptional activator